MAERGKEGEEKDGGQRGRGGQRRRDETEKERGGQRGRGRESDRANL